MWPWEHVLFGYLAYSLFSRAYYRQPPSGDAAWAVVVASLLPDLIDKPLSWEFGVFASGYALGHSILFAAPLSIAAILIADRYGRPRVGVAFALAYLLHLLGDVIEEFLLTGDPRPELLLWPVVTIHGSHHGGGLMAAVRTQFASYAAAIVTLDPTPYLLLQLVIAAGALALWIADGLPGVRR